MHGFLTVRRATLLLAILIVAITAQPSQAESFIEAYYRGDILRNSNGGLATGTSYLDDAGLKIGADFDGIFGATDGKLFANLLYNNGATFSDRYVGDLQVVSNIDAPEAIRIFGLWYEQFWNDKYSLKVGLYNLNSEFDAIDTAGLFMNSSHGIGAEYSQSGLNGPSIFPNTSLTVRFDWQLSDSTTLRYALLDGVPGDPDDPSKTTIQLSSDDGVLNALEYNYVLEGGTRFGLGGWLYSADFDLLEGQDLSGAALRDNGNSGLYGFVDTPLPLFADGGIESSAFLRYGIANDDINARDAYIGGGIVMTGLIKSRPDDVIGLAFASAQMGDPYRRVVADAGGRSESSETSIELTYSTQLTDWLRIQPDVQYIVNPGVDPTLDNALVIGLKFKLTTARVWD